VAFADCIKLTSIICKATTPPIINNRSPYATFIFVPTNIPVYVPCISLNDYLTSNWNAFTNFIGVSNATFIPDTTFIFDTICHATVYNDNGFAIHDGAGTYHRTATTADNCDSIICLILSEYTAIPITIYSDTICQGDTYNFYGKPLTATGIYQDTLQTTCGCDSIIKLTLIVNPVPTVPIVATICQGDTYNFYGKPLTATDIYQDTLQTTCGCDSIIKLTLIVNPVPTVPTVATICQGDTYNFYGKPLTATDIYRDTLQTIHGCDSIIELTLIVNPVPPVTKISDSIYIGNSYDFNGKLLTIADIYYDTLQTIHGCDSIIELTLTITSVGIVETDNYPSLRIYPNPTTGKFKIEIADQTHNDGENIEIYDIFGKHLLSLPSLLSPETTIDISYLANGIYFLKLNKLIYKIIKK
jgi:hypothetical protein